MIKYFCDHCGKELGPNNTVELWNEDTLFFYDGDFIGKDNILCNDCYDERIRLHIDLDRSFFNAEENK